jgi:hypothetical protein
LWDFFVDIRRSVASAVPPKFLIMKAKTIADEVLKVQRETGCYGPLPKIDKHWLLRWKRDKGVVFRRPNLRYKTSKAVLLSRLRAMWVNSFKVRHLAQRLLNKDLSGQIFGIDEKPLHFNEAGSKGVRTLEIVGAPAVKLKENHAATRERVSVMTMVTSSVAAVQQGLGLPVLATCGDPLSSTSPPTPPYARTHEHACGVLRVPGPTFVATLFALKRVLLQ